VVTKTGEDLGPLIDSARNVTWWSKASAELSWTDAPMNVGFDQPNCKGNRFSLGGAWSNRASVLFLAADGLWSRRTGPYGNFNQLSELDNDGQGCKSVQQGGMFGLPIADAKIAATHHNEDELEIQLL
jgi:hypothetical protein